MKKKKILFILWSYTSGGGAERVLSTLVNSLAKYDYEIDILEYWHSNCNSFALDDRVNLLEPIVDPMKDNKIVRVMKKLLVYFIPSLLRKKYAYKNYDVEISFNYMIPTFLLNKKCKKVAWLHGDIYELSSNKPKYLIQRKYLNRVDSIVSISNNTYESILSVYPEYKDKTVIINNAYDFDEIIKKSMEFEVKDFKDSKVLLFLGRFDENKNPLFLIEVLNKIKHQNVVLLYIGRGQLRKKLEEESKKLGKSIHIMDYQKNPYPYIKRADLLLCSSKSEGFPTTLVEGLVLKTPFISTKVGGTSELSNNNKCGFVTNDVLEYAKRIDELLENDNLYKQMSQNCSVFAKKYSPSYQAEKVNNLLKEIIIKDNK